MNKLKLKQHVFLVFILLLFASSLDAQSKFKIGISGGGGLSGWYDKSDNQYLGDGRVIKHQFTTAYAFGFFSEYELVKRITLNAEILYLKSGSKHIDKTDAIHYPTGGPFIRIEEIKYRVHNIQFPMSLSIKLFRLKYIPFIKLGAVSNYIINGNREYYYFDSRADDTENTVEDLNFNTDRNREFKIEIKPFIGIGVQLSDKITFESNLSVGKQFHYSLVSDDFVCPEKSQCNTSELSYNNRSVLVVLRYIIN